MGGRFRGELEGGKGDQEGCPGWLQKPLLAVGKPLRGEFWRGQTGCRVVGGGEKRLAGLAGISKREGVISAPPFKCSPGGGGGVSLWSTPENPQCL